jgi:hypothetical protein
VCPLEFFLQEDKSILKLFYLVECYLGEDSSIGPGILFRIETWVIVV